MMWRMALGLARSGKTYLVAGCVGAVGLDGYDHYLKRKSTASIILSMATVWDDRNMRTLRVDINSIDDHADIPDAVDWRGYLSPVRKQSGCGCCWAMATVAAVESSIFLKTGRLIPLSVQHLLDSNDMRLDCIQGEPLLAIKYLLQAKEIATEKSYPYLGVLGGMLPQKVKNRLWRKKLQNLEFSQIVSVPKGDEDALKKAVALYGPVIAAVCFDMGFYRNYSEGIFSDPDYENRTPIHSVLLVGYGTEDGEDFWIVQNSWGSGWGERGFARIARNANNMCGIVSEDSCVVCL